MRPAVYRRSRSDSKSGTSHSSVSDDILSLNSWSEVNQSHSFTSSYDSSFRHESPRQSVGDVKTPHENDMRLDNQSQRDSDNHLDSVFEPTSAQRYKYKSTTSHIGLDEKSKKSGHRNTTDRNESTHYSQSSLSKDEHRPTYDASRHSTLMQPSINLNHSAAPYPVPVLDLDQQSSSNHGDNSSVISSSGHSSPLILNAQNLYSRKQLSDQADNALTNRGDKNKFPAQAKTTSSHQLERQHFFDYHNDRSFGVSNTEILDSGPSSSPATFIYDADTASSLAPVSRLDDPDSAPSSFSGYQTQPPSRLKKSNQMKIPESSKMLHFSQPNISSTMPSPGLRQQKSSSDLESLLQAWEHRLERDNVKTKMLSVWNNIKYGWTFKAKSSIKLDTPMFLLGESYHKRSEDDEHAESEFLKDFSSRIWLTYRLNFYPIPGTKLKTDCGWGCMLRSGQMLIAQCLIAHYLSRDWRMYNQQTETQLTFYREIIRWFSDPIDSPSDHIPLCLHNLVKFGRSYNKVPGEWYGPASVAHILRDAINHAGMTVPVLSQLCVYVAQDCTVYINDVQRLCRSRGKSDSCSGSFDQTGCQSESSHETHTRSSSPIETSGPWLRSLIMLIPVRLGGEAINELYSPCIKNLLCYQQCMGIIGGKPKHSLYFIGFQEDKLIYLDPHYCRDAVDTKENNFPIETYHCMSPRKLPISRMDPSCTIGFYIKNADEFESFIQDVQGCVSPPNQRGTYPLFIFSRGSQEDASQASETTGVERGRVRVRHYLLDENGERRPDIVHESEEFVML